MVIKRAFVLRAAALVASCVFAQESLPVALVGSVKAARLLWLRAHAVGRPGVNAAVDSTFANILVNQ